MMTSTKSSSSKICIMCQNRSSITDTRTDDPLERITYHKLPANVERRNRWLEFCGLTKDSFPKLSYRFLCSNHFEPECFERDLRAELLYGTKRKSLKVDAVPTIRTEGQQLKRQLEQQTSEENERKRRKEVVERLLNGEIATSETIVNPFRNHVCDEPESAAQNDGQMSTVLGNSNKSDLLHVLPPMNEAEMVRRIVKLQQTTNEQQMYISQLLRTINVKTEKINFAKSELVNMAISLQELKDQENRHVNARVTDILGAWFGEGQLAAILAGRVNDVDKTPSQISWTTKELSQALELRCISAGAFEHVKRHMWCPLPEPTEIQRWIHSIYLQTGHNSTALRLLQLYASTLTETDRICTVCLSRVAAPVRYHYDGERDQIVGPKSQLHFITVQGIFATWQQTVHIAFDLVDRGEIIAKLVADLHRVGYRVVALTAGCDRDTADLWAALNVTREQHYIRHPETDDLIYTFSCPNRTLAAIHRILIEDGIVMQENNVTISKGTLMTLFNRNDCRRSQDIKIDPKYFNIECLQELPNDYTASRELISSSTSNALKILAKEQGEDDVLSTLATLFDLFVDWYELCTASSDAPERTGRQQIPITHLPYGRTEDEQNIVLDGMYDVMETLRCVHPDNDYLPEAVLISISSMRKLLADLRTMHPNQIKDVPMRRLSSMPMDATLMRLHVAIQGTAGSRTLSVDDVLFHVCSTIASDDMGSHVTNQLLQRGELSEQFNLASLRHCDEKSDPHVLPGTDGDPCFYLTHFIVTQLGHKYDYLGERSVVIERKNDHYVLKPSNVDVLEDVTPSALWAEQAKKLESYLQDIVHYRKAGLAETLINSIRERHPRMGSDIIEMYVKKRIAIKVQELNTDLLQTSNR